MYQAITTALDQLHYPFSLKEQNRIDSNRLEGLKKKVEEVLWRTRIAPLVCSTLIPFSNIPLPTSPQSRPGGEFKHTWHIKEWHSWYDFPETQIKASPLEPFYAILREVTCLFEHRIYYIYLLSRRTRDPRIHKEVSHRLKLFCRKYLENLADEIVSLHLGCYLPLQEDDGEVQIIFFTSKKKRAACKDLCFFLQEYFTKDLLSKFY